VSRRQGGRWTTFHSLALVAAIAIGALGGRSAESFAVNQTKKQILKDREYSNPSKFSEPKYANFKAMEVVSIACTRILFQMLKYIKIGNQRDPSCNRR